MIDFMIDALDDLTCLRKHNLKKLS